MSLLKKILIIIITLFFSAYVFSIQFELLTIDVWCELEPPVREQDTEYPLSKKQAATHILNEARFIFSGMIYGFDFSYVPFDKSRNTQEQFILTPIAEIPWGDKNLKIIDVEQRNKKLFAKVQYELEDFQINRRGAWLSNTIPSATGSGEGNLFRSYTEKKTSYEQAIKNAIRNLLRPQYFNKPRQIIGQALIEEAPDIFISSGTYVSKLRVKLKIQEVIPYSVF
ncbi:MAG: hypothetical protein JW822_00580 [Spirochaetales bacterium]|nr:hypothetical protein [Spirochaetales bacterium]